MECLEAQEIVSAALDSEWTDADSLERAKSHCRDCEECAAYVRALVAVRRAVAPEPPADLADRIMVSVRAQAASAGQTAEATSLPASSPSPAPSPAPAPVGPALWARLSDPRHRKAVVAWSAAAAAVFIAAGFGAVAGMRSIVGGPSTGDVAVLESSGQANYDAQSGSLASGTAADSSAAAGASAVGAASPETAKSASGEFIVVGGAVYRSSGVDPSVTRGSLTTQGSTRTSLDTGGSPADLNVYGTGDPARVFIQLEDQTMLGFNRVTTTFQGRNYVLRSGPIAGFSEAVTLPDGITEPTSSDGSPTFELLDESAQPPVYVRTGRSAAEGIALPPGAQPGVGNTWSWWTPAAE